MHLHRIVLHGPPVPVARTGRALEDLGAEEAFDESWVLALDRPLASIVEISAREPDVLVTVERFELLGDERVSEQVRAGEVTVFGRIRLVLRSDDEPFGQFVDVFGEGVTRFDVSRLREAAEAVLLARDLAGPREGVTSRERARLLGRLATREAPDAEALALVCELGASALAEDRCEAEPGSLAAAYERSWILTCAVRHAACTVLPPGIDLLDDWELWIDQLLHGVAIDVLDSGGALDGEGWASAPQAAATGRLLATCLQVLAVFGVPATAPDLS